MTKPHHSHHVSVLFFFLILAFAPGLLFQLISAAEENPVTLNIAIDKETMVKGESFTLYANLSEKGTISIEIDNPESIVVYLKTVTTDDEGHAIIELKVPSDWSFGSYTVYASASTSSGEKNDTTHFVLEPTSPQRYPDFSLGIKSIWIGLDVNATFGKGERINVSAENRSKGVETTLLVFVNVLNVGDIKGEAKVRVFINKRNGSNSLGTRNISLEAGTYEILTFPLHSRFLPEKENHILVMAFIEEIIPEDKNGLDNTMERAFTVTYTEPGDKASVPFFPSPPQAFVIVSFASIFTSVYLYTDQGRYKLFSFFLFLESIVSKRDREKEIVEHTIRGRIYQYVSDHPLCRTYEIKRDVDVANGTMYYHIGWLEKGNYIRSKDLKNGNKTFWSSDLVFPDKKRYPNEKYPAIINENQRMIAFVLFSKGLLTVKELSEHTHIPHTTITDNLREMKRTKMVVKERKGFSYIYSLDKDYEIYFREYEMKIKDT